AGSIDNAMNARNSPAVRIPFPMANISQADLDGRNSSNAIIGYLGHYRLGSGFVPDASARVQIGLEPKPPTDAARCRSAKPHPSVLPTSRWKNPGFGGTGKTLAPKPAAPPSEIDP